MVHVATEISKIRDSSFMIHLGAETTVAGGGNDMERPKRPFLWLDLNAGSNVSGDSCF